MSKLPAPKRRRLSPPGDKAAVATNNFYDNASRWDLEGEYMERMRQRKSKEKKKSDRLPIRNEEGQIEEAPAPEPVVQEVVEEEDSFLGSGDEDDEVEEEPAKPQKSVREQILEAKEEMAKIASSISEDPEEHIGQLKNLAELARSRNMVVRKLAMVTQLAVYKDIIPGYRIRPVSEEELKQKLSKDVRKLRNFEQGLVRGYQEYVQDLRKTAKGSAPDRTEAARSIASVAISCASQLLELAPHFNYRTELLQLMVDKLSTRNLGQDFSKCRQSIETLFRDDEDGNASLEAVTMLTKMMKTKSYHIHESVLNTFLHLRLLSEFAHKASTNRIDKPGEDEPQPMRKMKKKEREFRTKKERKNMRDRKEVEKEMKEADAAVSHEERDKNQADTLKQVFVAYFRILKSRNPGLMGAVLEGLARYAHLINQDFFGDILEALRDLIAYTSDADDDDNAEEDEDEESATSARDLTRESLLCVITAFALLQGQIDVAKQADTLHLDLNFFITHLYRTLIPSSLNPDIELSAKSLHLPDPDTRQTKTLSKINVQTTIVLLLRSLSSVLMPALNTRAVPPLRVAAFTKQLLTASLQLPEKSALAMIGLLRQCMKVHGTKVAALWFTEERKGDGTFDALREEVEGSNPFAATVWEGELLRKHYAPDVREAIVGLEKSVLSVRSGN